MIIRDLYFVLLTVITAYILLNTLVNLVYRLRLPKSEESTGDELVSVLIPARNEEHNIGSCLDTLVGQRYGNIEILVLDDESQDNTWSIISGYARKYSNIRIFKGTRRPAGWKGKSWALQQLSEKSRGSYLYMTDADTLHDPSAVGWAVKTLKSRKIDVFSAMPRQVTAGFWEKLLVPMIYLPFFLIPLPLLNARFMRKLSVGIGQFFFFKREVFTRIGGMEEVKNKISEDVAMSKLLKQAGFSYHFLDTRGLVECKMYGGFRESIKGLSKNLYDIVSFSPFLSVVISIVGFLFLVAPAGLVLGFAAAAIQEPIHAETLMLFISAAVLTVSWAVHMSYYRAKAGIILIYPLFFLALILLIDYSMYNYLTGRKPVWKARVLSAS